MSKEYLNNIFIDEWDTLFNDQPIYLEDPEEVQENKTFTVTIIQPTDAIIEVTVNNTQVYTSTFTANWDDTYTVGFKNGLNPSNLILNGIKGKITRDITIKANPNDGENKHATFTITIEQTSNQTINVLHNNKIKTKSFIAQRYDYYTSSLDVADGYIGGKITNGAGTVTSDVTISASPATKIQEYVNIKITQSAHQTITVTCNNKKYTTSFAVKKGTNYQVSIKADAGYMAGAIIDSGEGQANENVEIYAFPSTVRLYNISIIQGENQTINVVYNDRTYTTNFTNVPYGTQLTAYLVADEGYEIGTLNANTLKVTKDFTFQAKTAAKNKMVNMIIPATINQTITVTYTPYGSSEIVVVKSNNKKQTISVPWGSFWEATITPISDYYNPGVLDDTSGVIKDTTIITASNAEIIKYNLTIPGVSNQSITVNYKEPNASKSYTVKSEVNSKVLNLTKMTTWSATVTANTGYTIGTLNPSNGTLISDTTIAINGVSLIDYTFTIPATTNQTITISYTKPDGTTGTIKSGTVSKYTYLPYGTKWTASISGSNGYTPGSLNKSSGTITSNTTLTITGATLNYYNLIIPATVNQTVKVTYTIPGKSAATISSGNERKILSVPWGTTWSTVVTPNTDYIAGTVNPSSGTITQNTTLNISDASLNGYILTIKKPTNGYIIITVDGVDTKYTSAATVKINKNKSVKVTAISNNGYKINNLEIS